MTQRTIPKPNARQSRPDRRTRRSEASHGGSDIMSTCVATCSQTLNYCLEQGGEHVDRDHIASLLDCIDACWFAIGLQNRDSTLAQQALRVCADACKNCEESCEEFGDDATVTKCADVCRECFEHCNNA